MKIILQAQQKGSLYCETTFFFKKDRLGRVTLWLKVFKTIIQLISYPLDIFQSNPI